ncbi:MAG: putative xanthine dehydrogenase subunit D [Bacteroidetes bacterium ADurb.Bin408]|nr:MAG: putative xanthine dehydrogenase subunit D [Bacteroidetes bacterium ADurb.Bin408]
MNKVQSQIPHESAQHHVTGQSVYINDIDHVANLLHGRIVYSPHAHARIVSYDISKARKLKGVKAVLTYKDIPGHNNIGPVVHDEPCLAVDKVEFIGQAVFLIAAETEDVARAAEKLISIQYEPLEAITDLPTAIRKKNLIAPPRKIETGNTTQALKKAPHSLKGTLVIGGQEHWYLETHAALCVPDEDHYKVYASSQNPTETQILVAEVLGLPSNCVEVEVKRMGGAFGGKETQGNHYACWAALLSCKTGQPVRISLFRDDDQKTTGKRHPFIIDYEVGFDDKGVISAVDFVQNANAGYATDLSMAILERAMLHAENAYYIPNMRIIGRAYKTNLPSNTAYRGFGGPQGMAAMETIIDRIARTLGKDATEIRFRNFYGISDRNITPYGQMVENNRLFTVYDKIIRSSDYYNRREVVNKFNAAHKYAKRGLALTPVKFGISFTTSFLNQAGALVHIYKDGSVLVSHGGTEMGQGLHTKIMQIAAAELGVSIHRIKVGPTNTSKVPNTSPTAASSGTDMNGMAVKNAVDKLKERIAEVVAAHFNEKAGKNSSRKENIIFENDVIYDSTNKKRCLAFEEAVTIAYLKQTSLSATGYYRTPDVNFNRETGKGKPFHYYTFAMAVAEVEVDILTGHHKILRTDIVFDLGDSINKLIDRGQIEGAFIQGVGWCTTEDMKYDKNGNLLNHSPDTYKIPTISDIPEDFRVTILDGIPNPNTIRRSKAVGEPPFMLCFSVWLAIKDAISAVTNHKKEPAFSIPATNEVILSAVDSLINGIDSHKATKTQREKK